MISLALHVAAFLFLLFVGFFALIAVGYIFSAIGEAVSQTIDRDDDIFLRCGDAIIAGVKLLFAAREQ